MTSAGRALVAVRASQGPVAVIPLLGRLLTRPGILSLFTTSWAAMIQNSSVS